MSVSVELINSIAPFAFLFNLVSLGCLNIVLISFIFNKLKENKRRRQNNKIIPNPKGLGIQKS